MASSRRRAQGPIAATRRKTGRSFARRAAKALGARVDGAGGRRCREVCAKDVGYVVAPWDHEMAQTRVLGLSHEPVPRRIAQP